MSNRRVRSKPIEPSHNTNTDNINSDNEHSDFDSSLAELATSTKKGTKRQKSTQDQPIDQRENETVDERRIRLAKEYLDSVGVSIDSDHEEDVLVETDSDGDDIYKHDAVALQLKQQAYRIQGREQRTSTVELMNFDHMKNLTPILHSSTTTTTTTNTQQKQSVPLFEEDPIWIRNGHRYYITSLTLSDDDTIAITGSHGGSINKHDIETGIVSKMSLGPAKGQNGHTGPVFGTTISSDNIYLATAGHDSTIRIWDLRSNQQVHLFQKHQEPATCVKFQKNSLTLFSSGYGRDIHAYDCEKMTYMETFYGPSAPTITMDCLYQNKVFIAGEDCIGRILKPETETITSFQGNKSELISIDALAAIDHDNIVTGSQTNILQLWNSSKKKSRDTIRNAHSGTTLSHLGTKHFGPTLQTLSKPIENWITSLTALYASDLIFSGSSDGYIRAWEAHLEYEQLYPLFNIPVKGFVNGLQISSKGQFLLAAVGKNHRLGTWQGHITDGVKEGLYMYSLSSFYEQNNNNNNTNNVQNSFELEQRDQSDFSDDNQ